MYRRLVTLVGALTVVVAGPLAPAQAVVPSITPAQVSTGFSGSAYGSYIFNSDKSLTSGPTATSSISCTGIAGLTSTNTGGAINIASVGRVGAATTSVKTLLSAAGKRIEGQSSTDGVNLLGGLITAGSVTSESSAEKSTTGAFTGTNKTTIAGLKVLGVPLGTNPAPNTVIDLKLPLQGSLGKITLNGQDKRLVNGTYQVSTTALRVEILKAGLAGLKVGTDIRIGVSATYLTPPQAGYLIGTGFGTRNLLASGLIASDPTALTYASCVGGTTLANSSGTTIPGVASTGTTSTKTVGVLAREPKINVTNSVASLNVLNGLVQADSIKAETTASRSAADGKITLTDTSSFVNLRIAGLPAINASVAPNTVVQVPGLGQVTLHKVSKSSTTIIVTMVEIVLNQTLGTLPAGSKIQIGYSGSGIKQ